MYYTYILYSHTFRRYYVGQTKDLEQRLRQHNQGRSKSTRGGRPWRLMYYIGSNDRAEAIRLEQRIKKRGVNRYLQEQKIDFNHKDP